ncbi:protein phosphatase 2C domain-containing protein [Desulfobacula sp.]|uniref:protein phosphatase 2C domain-containing protein n=1 Tax=Desulfobacula sp. TaxID=2593537 RepID=UPI002621AF2F|nr:protein phosphatase 2C domain-containing protein [Desulfobacula sp.]
MEIEHILEKGSGRLNEDAVIIEDSIYGVFDGASSLDNKVFDGCKTGGMMASATAGQIFSKNHFPLMQLGRQANTAILSKMMTHQVNLSQRHTLWSTSAAVVRVGSNTLEWLQTGDAFIILIYTDDSYKVLVDKEDHDYETLLMLKKNYSHKDPAFKQQVKKIRSNMNKTYGVLNGEPGALDFVNSGFLPLEDVKTILLFTDGLQLPSTIPEKKKNFKQFMTLYQKLGLTGLKNHVRQLESQDPDIRLYPRFKCHDDIAAIAIHP